MREKIKYLQSVFGKAKLQNNGIELMVKCPGKTCRKSNKLKMNIRLDNDLYHCWVCNLRGRNISKLIQMRDPSKLAGYLQKFKSYNYLPRIDTDPIEQVNLPEGFKLLMTNLNDPDAKAIRKYALSRGISDRMLWRFRAGFSDSFKFKRRLILPSFDKSGILNYWIARSIDEESYIKYLNAKSPKTSIIFNEIDLDLSSQVLLVEGPLDLIKCVNLNATCLLGSSLNENSLLFYELVNSRCEVVLCLDPDAVRKQNMIASMFAQYDTQVSVLELKNGDIGDLSPTQINKLMPQAKKWIKSQELLNRIQKI